MSGTKGKLSLSPHELSIVIHAYRPSENHTCQPRLERNVEMVTKI